MDPQLVEYGDRGKPFLHYAAESPAAKAFASVINTLSG
jgi:hypothetical protein